MKRFDDISEIRYERFDGRTALLRLIESIGYRFGRAAAGLDARHMGFLPIDGAMDLGRLVCHIGHLVQSVTNAFSDGKSEMADWDIEQIRAGIAVLYVTVESLTAEAIAAREREESGSVFYLINGPLSDALWHIGQLSTYKKLLGIKASPGGFYRGESS